MHTKQAREAFFQDIVARTEIRGKCKAQQRFTVNLRCFPRDVIQNWNSLKFCSSLTLAIRIFFLIIVPLFFSFLSLFFFFALLFFWCIWTWDIYFTPYWERASMLGILVVFLWFNHWATWLGAFGLPVSQIFYCILLFVMLRNIAILPKFGRCTKIWRSCRIS